jgi:hypothetical protein
MSFSTFDAPNEPPSPLLRRLSLTGLEGTFRRFSLSKVAPLRLVGLGGQQLDTRCPDEVEDGFNGGAPSFSACFGLLNSPYIRSSAFAYDEWLNDGVRRTEGRQVIHPHSVVRITWDAVIVVATVAMACIVPMRAAFSLDNPSLGAQAFDACTDAIFAIDILFNLITNHAHTAAKPSDGDAHKPGPGTLADGSAAAVPSGVGGRWRWRLWARCLSIDVIAVVLPILSGKVKVVPSGCRLAQLLRMPDSPRCAAPPFACERGSQCSPVCGRHAQAHEQGHMRVRLHV